jgi:hypothetical protein
MLTLFLIGYLSVLAVAALPRWSYNQHWGYYPCSAIAAVLASVVGASLVV